MSQRSGNWVQRNARQRAVRDRGWAPGPVRRAFTVKRTDFSAPPRQPLRATGQFSQPKSKPIIVGKTEFKRSWIPSKVGLAGTETGTKLYISNLHYKLKNGDIDGLFSQIGKLKHCRMHYGRTGLRSGSAEVVYERRVDAIKALKYYNNVPLEGRIMKITIVDNDLGQSMAHRISFVGDVIVPHNVGGSTPRVHKTIRQRRFNRGDWMQRNRRINFQHSGQEVADMSEDGSGTEFEKLRVEAMYFQ